MTSITFYPDPNAMPYLVIPDSIHRIKVTFRVDFTNGGHVYGEDFLLDIPDDSVGDARVAEMIVSAMNLLRAGPVTLLSTMVVRRGEHDDVYSNRLTLPMEEFCSEFVVIFAIVELISYRLRRLTPISLYI